MDFYVSVVGEDGCRLHDPLAVAVAIDDRSARLVTTRVEVETEGRWTMGETVADLAGPREPMARRMGARGERAGSPSRSRQEFMDRFVERVRSLVEAGVTGSSS